MSVQHSPSPQLQAEQFVRCNLDALNLQELLAHEREATTVLAGLNDYLCQPGRSVGALCHARQLSRKVQQQMAHLRALIYGRQGAVALTHAMAAGHQPLGILPMASPGKRGRVVRSLPSANNAASDPSMIPDHALLGRDAEASEGGEAKEASGPESPAKPGEPA